jgi:hypothetical protein
MAAPVEARNVVLIHGAWADGSSWAEGYPTPSGGGPEGHRGTKSADHARRFCRCDTPRIGAARWPDRPGRAFLGRHRPQRGRGQPQRHGACLYRGAGVRCRGRFYRAFRKISCWTSAGGHPAAERFHHNFGGGVSKILRERFRPPQGKSSFCRAGACRRFSVRRTNSGCLALQTVMVCRVESRIRRSIPT